MLWQWHASNFKVSKISFKSAKKQPYTTDFYIMDLSDYEYISVYCEFQGHHQDKNVKFSEHSLIHID